jgi:AcrR family transcriptional regulator
MIIPPPVAESSQTSGHGDHQEWCELGTTAKRERVLRAANAVFAQAGLQAPMSNVADAAGAGVASVYRLFPSKHELLAALVVRRNDRIAAATRRAAERDGDRWSALTGLLAEVAESQSPDEVLGQARLSVGDHPDVVASWQGTAAALEHLLDAARREGRLRADATTDDLRLIFSATRAARRVGADAWRRTLSLMIAGLDTRRPDGRGR